MENRRGQGFLLGLTGGVGAGKSTVLSYLEEAYGFHVIQTDLTARRLMEPGMEGFQTAVRLFGADILDASGAICRPVLAERMFREPEKRRQSDAAIHPLVWKAVREEAAAFRNGPVVIETAVPGKEFRDSCREIWYLYTSEEIRAARLRESRGEVCRQYAELSAALGAAASELSAELSPDPLRERRLRQHFTAMGREAEPAVYYDESGRLRIEIEGVGLQSLRRGEAVKRLAQLMDKPLRLVEECPPRHDRVVLAEREPFMAMAGVAARKKDGETVSGDTGAWFKQEDGSLFVLLCDGMGSGPSAHRESSEAVRLLEQFLRAGVPPEEALRTLSGALALQGEETGGFTTIDLMRVDLFTGAAAVYKYGAAPTYVKKGNTVQRITGSTLPAGLSPVQGAAPDVSRFSLEPGDCVLMVSDGVAGGEGDVWLRERLRSFQGESPKELARILIEEGQRRVGSGDDRTAILLRLERRTE